jgi:hypothetical protein
VHIKIDGIKIASTLELPNFPTYIVLVAYRVIVGTVIIKAVNTKASSNIDISTEDFAAT